MASVNVEQEHYSIQELAECWGLSDTYLRRVFRNEPGVLHFGEEVKGHKRGYQVLRVPREVAERVYRRVGGGGLPEVKLPPKPKPGARRGRPRKDATN